MKVIVTGAAGFIGRHVSRALVERGDHVVGFDRRIAPGAVWQQVRCDVATQDGLAVLRAATRDAGAVVHLAALPGVRTEVPNLAARRHSDIVLSTASVLAATPLGVPIIATSSSSVYGGARRVGGELRPSEETDRLRPGGGYAVAKAAMERLLEQRRHLGSPVATLRPFTVVGPGQRPDMALARWLAAARGDREITVIGSVERTRDFTDVAVVTEAVLAAVDHSYSGVANVGSGRPHTLAGVIAAVEIVTGHPLNVRLTAADDDEVVDSFANTTRLQMLGVHPRINLVDVVDQQWQQLIGERAAA